MQKAQKGAAGALAICLLAGCHPGGGKSGTGGAGGAAKPPVAPSPAPEEARGADLTRPFNMTAWYQGGRVMEPLMTARQMARSAGGVWAALAPKPLDDVKLTPNYRETTSLTVAEMRDALKKAGTPLAWEDRKDYVFLYFGPQKDMERVRAQPPQEVVGLFLSAPTGEAMLAAVGGLWKIEIKADPALLKERAALLAARKLQKKDDAPRGAFATMYSGYGRGMGETETEPPPGALEFLVMERLTLAEMMKRLADYFGGECQNVGGTKWEFTRLTDPKKIAEKAAHWKQVIEQDAGAHDTAAFSSYASRHGEGMDGGETDAPTPLPPLREETRAAFDGLGMLGKPALPTLTGYLDAEKAGLAQAAMETLSAMSLPEANRALADFARRLQKPPEKGKKQPFRAPLQTALIGLITRSPSPETAPLLAETARDAHASEEARRAARMALVESGNLKPFETANPPKELPPGEAEFLLKETGKKGSGGEGEEGVKGGGGETRKNMGIPPEGAIAVDPTPNAQRPNDPTTQRPAPLATTTPPGGETWAVFLAGRYGDPNDLWLARRRGGKWAEFLFTGKPFPRGNNYGRYGGEPPKPGSCVLKVAGDKITISPPDVNLKAEEERIVKKMYDQKLPAAERQKLMQRYSQISQRNAGTMAQAVTLSLADLRKDADKDGLTDVVEARLGTDPKKADGDGDGVPDAKDPNPLAAPNPSPSDRERLLQTIFTALYGGDTSREPIIVLLERAQWQEFRGASARVLCIAKKDYARRARNLGALRVLQFGGPTDADSTILTADGPVLFNDSRTKAEIHFWQWNRPAQGSTSYSPYAALMGGSDAMPTDYMARFERSGDWKLTKFGAWRFDTADKAIAESMRGAMTGMGGGVID